MSRPYLRPALIVCLAGLYALAQSYQTQFGDIKFDRTKGPSTFSGGVEVEAATGRASIRIPLGPGLSVRGMKYVPTVSGNWLPQVLAQRNDGVITKNYPEYPITLANGGFTVDPKRIVTRFNTFDVVKTFKGEDATPASMEHDHFEAPGITGSFMTRPKALDPLDPDKPSLDQVRAIVAAFGYDASTWDIAHDKLEYPIMKDANGNPIDDPNNPGYPLLNPLPDTWFIHMGEQGQLIVGLRSSSFPERKMLEYKGADGSTWNIPSAILVISGDVAYQFGSAPGTGKYVNAGQPGITRLLYLSSDLVAMRNRSGDEFRFSNDQVQWYSNGQDTGIGIRITKAVSSQNGVGSITYAYHGVPDAATYTVNLNGVPRKDGLESPSALPVLDSDEANREYRVASIVSSVSQETITFGYTKLPAIPWGALDRLASPEVLASVSMPGRSIRLTWGAPYYVFVAEGGPVRYQHKHQIAVGTNSGDSGMILLPRWTYGVTNVEDTDTEAAEREEGQISGKRRPVAHYRTVPTPDFRSDGNWLSTTFHTAVVHPDGSTTVHIFMEPISGTTINTPELALRHLVSNKHQAREIREYAAGVPWESDLSKGPLQSTAHRITLLDRWDLRHPGNPKGLFEASAHPYPTRTRVIDRLAKTYSSSEQVDWNSTSRSWDKTNKSVQDLAAATGASLAIEVQSMARLEGVAPPLPAPVNGVNQEETHLEYPLAASIWRFGLPLENKTLTTTDSSVTKAAGIVVPFTTPPVVRSYDPGLGRVKTVKVGSGTPITTTFNYVGDQSFSVAASQLSSVDVNGPGEDPDNPVGVSRYDYDPLFGWMTTITPKGVKWSLGQSADGLNRVSSQTDANRFKTEFTWDGEGRLKSIQPPNNEVATRFQYYPLERRVVSTRGPQESQQESQYVYNAFGELILERRKSTASTFSYRLFSWDNRGRKRGETVWLPGEGDPKQWPLANLIEAAWTVVGYKTHYECLGEIDDEGNCLGRRVLVSEPIFGTAQPMYKGLAIGYDNYGRVVKTTDPNGVVTETTYNGRVKTVTVGPGATTTTPASTTFENDTLGRLWRVTDANGNLTIYSYDPVGRVTGVVQKNASASLSQTRTWEYDALGRLIVLNQPESGRTEYSNFTLQGKPKTVVYGALSDAPKTVTTEYGSLGRVKTITSNDGSVNDAFAYDEPGRGSSNNMLTTATTAQGVSRMLTYGGLNGRLSSLERTVDGHSFTMWVDWDLDGTLKNRTYPNHVASGLPGPIQTFTPDPIMGVPSATGYAGSSLASMQYDPTCWMLTSIEFTNGARSRFTYGQDQTRLSSITHGRSVGAAWAQWIYGYDERGNLTRETDLISGTADVYTYDRLNRLESVFVWDPFASAGLQQSFCYDAFGNRQSLTSLNVSNWAIGQPPPSSPISGGASSKAQSYAFKAADLALKNQIPASTNTGVSTGAIHDRQGNLLEIYGTPGDSTTLLTMTYDALGRVTSLGGSKNTPQAYSYDDQGLRFKTVDKATGKTTYNVYNEARQLIAQYEKLGTGPLDWKKDILYVGTKEVAEVDATGTTRVTLTDHLGSPRLIWNGTALISGKPDGVNLIQQKFLPFGETLSDPISAAKIAKGFTNHEQTDPSGLIYMQARFYAPWYGRFLSPDPARDQHFEETQSWNIYSYVQNNPTMSIDPDGQLKRDAKGNLIKSPFIREMGSIRRSEPMFRGHAGDPSKQWRTQEFTLTTDDGKGSALGVQNLDKDARMNFDCHGLTFAKGDIWINDSQVPAILKGDGYSETSKPGVGDVGVYYVDGKVEHSVTVSGVDKDGSVTGVVGLGGIQTQVSETTPQGGWKDGANIKYYKKGDDKRTDEQRKKDVEEMKKIKKPEENK